MPNENEIKPILITNSKYETKYTLNETNKKKKDKISTSEEETTIVFKDKNGDYPYGKIIKNDKMIIFYNYDYTKDKYGNVLSCKMTTHKTKNGKSIDIDKESIINYFDKNGYLVRTQHNTRDGITYLTKNYEYNDDGDLTREITKGTQTITYRKYHKKDLESITTKTIKSKMIHTNYRAYFDSKDRVYKVIDGDKGIERDYERDLDETDNVLSETIRFFDITTTNKKLISYKTICYSPASGYKISKVIENGIVKEENIYDLNGELVREIHYNDKQISTIDIERSTDPDTENITIITTHTNTDKDFNVLEKKIIKSVYNKDKTNLLYYSTDDSIVSTYEYDEFNRRKSVTIKKLINDEFKIISEIKFIYTTDKETGINTKTRIETDYDKNGNTIKQEKHTDTTGELIECYETETKVFERTDLEEV